MSEDNKKVKIIFTDRFKEDCERLGWKEPTGWSLKKIYWRLIPYEWRPKQIWYKLKCFFWYRYRTVRPRSLSGHEWIDRDELMLHCCFELLVQFIDNECLDKKYRGRTDWNYDEKYRKVFATMMDLYNWWKDDYPDMDRGHPDTEKEEQKRLHQLINIRPYMWT